MVNVTPDSPDVLEFNSVGNVTSVCNQWINRCKAGVRNVCEFSMDLPLVIGGFDNVTCRALSRCGTSLVSMTLEVLNLKRCTVARITFDFIAFRVLSPDG